MEVAGELSSFHDGGTHQMGESQNSAARGTQDTHTVPPPPPPTHMQHGRGHGESLHILHKQPQRHASAAEAVLDSVEARRGAGVDGMVVGEGGCEYVMESENVDLEDLGRDSSSLAGSNAESDVSTHHHALPHTASRCNRHTQRGLIRGSPSPPLFLWIVLLCLAPPPFRLHLCLHLQTRTHMLTHDSLRRSHAPHTQICTHTRTCIHTCTHTHTQLPTHALSLSFFLSRTHAHMQLRIHQKIPRTRACTKTYKHVCTHTHAHTNINTHAHTNTHTYSHICTYKHKHTNNSLIISLLH